MPIRAIKAAKSVTTPAGATPFGDTSHIVARPRTRSPNMAPPDAPSPSDRMPPDGSQLPARPKRAHHVVDRAGPNWDENGDFLVGRGRPPRETQWQKGQSGNPRGPKPKEILDPQAEFTRQVLEKFNAKVNGEEVSLNLGTFALSLLKGSAAKGVVKSQQLILELFITTLRNNVARDPTPEILAWEQEIIDQLLEEHGLPAKPVVRNTDRSIANEGEVA